MKKTLALLLLLTSLALSVSAAAAPIPGAERRATQWDAGPTFFQAPSACTTFPGLTGRTPDLHMSIEGWYGPVTGDTSPVFEVQLTATVKGTVTDASGNVYRVVGHFSERSVRSLFADTEIEFRGTGHLVVTRPAGTYAGQATAAAVAGPPERQLTFTDMDVCNTR
jgi:hypothetical protein